MWEPENRVADQTRNAVCLPFFMAALQLAAIVRVCLFAASHWGL